MSKLVIIESSGKIKSYEKALGSGYKVVSSFGHCVDLPAKGLSVNIKKDFEPTFDITPDKIDVVKSLRLMVKKASAVYLMSDPDREGEAIAFHLKNVLSSNTKATFHRASTNEITQAAIKKSIANPGDIDMDVIDAYLCRRILDRLAGYRTSFLTQQATGGRSAGRVQSAMLRILTEREKEILNFIPEEYWVLTANFISSEGDGYIGVLEEKIKVPNEKKATEIYDAVINGSPVIASVESKDVSSSPYAPFTTATLIQSGSTLLGWTASKTMKVAQTLYEGGFCTYMRTDSPTMSHEAIGSVREYIGTTYGNSDYLHPTVRMYAKKGSQEGHECCRPTKIDLPMVSADGDGTKLYNLIWRRAIASQMTAGKDRRIKAITKTGGYDFISRGNVRLFDGYRKVWQFSKQDDIILPDLKQGEKSTLQSLLKEQKWTTPPPRYSDASLSKKCETSQITRPATFASFLKTLENRGYIERKKKAFHATKLGIRVVDFLVAADMCFVDLKFTADMENTLDQIANGSQDKLEVLTNFWEKLKVGIANGKQLKEEWQITDHPCKKCDGKLKLKHSKFGPFYSCENYSKKEGEGCDFIAKVGENDEPIAKVAVIKEYASFQCKNCGSKMIKRKSKFGEFFGCQEFPKCRTTSDLDGIFKEPKEGKGKWKNYKKKTTKKKSAKKKTTKKKIQKKTTKPGKKK